MLTRGCPCMEPKGIRKTRKNNINNGLGNTANKDLHDALKKAEKKIVRLEASQKKRRKSQKNLESLTHKLQERVKELNCLYTISSIVEKQGVSLEEVLQTTVDIIPDAWQYPEITCSRIVLSNQEFKSACFTETPWKQFQKIIIHGERTGFLEVFYREEKPIEDEGPFLREERSLISVIAERIGEIVERKRAEEALYESESKNLALLDAIPDLMFQVNDTGVLLGFHEGKFSIPRESADQIIGKNIYTLFAEKRLLPKRALDQAMIHVKRTLETGKAQIFEQHIPFNGDQRDFEVRMVACTNNNVLGIVRDVTRRKRLEHEILEISGREQRRIGQDLHDSLCQHLAGIGFMGKVLEKKITEQQSLAPADVNEIVELIDQAITMTRGFARGLNPVRLEADGFVCALSELAGNVEKLFGIVCRFEYTDMILIHDNALATHLYRIVQEALNNAIKHGKADTVTIMLHQEGATCILTVQDNGLGIGNMVHQGKGIGLNIMQYRASMIGASLDVRNAEFGGTILTCSFQNKDNV
jgi:signal transduction histidine kinase